MIKRTLISFLLIFIVYVIFREYIIPNISRAEVKQLNSIRAQKILYNQDLRDNVIVGTSLTANLPMDSLPNFENLAFGAENVYVGLELLIRRGYFPKRVFIESNFIARTEDTNLLGKISNPILYESKKRFPFLEDGKEPIPLIELLVEKSLKKVVPDYFRVLNQEIKKDDKVNDWLNNYFMKLYNKALTEDQENEIQKKLDSYISILEEYGSEVVFFEMKMHPRLQELPYFITSRKLLQDEFISDRLFMERLIDYPYNTTDGLHLDYDGLAKSARSLRIRTEGLN